MKEGGRKAARFFLKLILVILVIMFVIVIVLSPLTKYLIRKNDVKYTGRHIEVAHVYINPFTGRLRLGDLKIHEPQSDSIFLSFHRLKVKLSVLKLLSGTYQVSSLKLDQPVVHVIRTDTVFNFTDLIRRFTQKPVDTTKGPTHLNILNIDMSGGEVVYSEPASGTKLTLSNINFSSPGKYWDRDSVNGKFSLKPDTGYLDGRFMVNTASKDYRFAMKAGDLALSAFRDFLTGFIKNPSVSAMIFADLAASGNYGDPMNVNARGKLQVNNFRISSGKESDFAAFRKFLLKIDEIDMKKNIFHIDTILIDSPYVKYERFDSLDNNISRAMTSRKPKPSKPDTINMALKLMNSDYYINDFEVRKANFRFEDFSIAEKFSMALNPFSIKTDSVDRKKRSIKISIDSKIEPYGTFSAFIRMNPKNQKNMSGDYKFENIPATVFNPYINTYTSYLLNRGKIQVTGSWSIQNDDIRNLNHFVVVDPSDIRRSEGKDSKRIPLPIIMAFVRERGRVIDYQIPVTGNLKNPKFHLRDVITDILRNIFVKPPTTPYRSTVQNVETEIDKTLMVEWKMRQAGLTTEQQRFLEGIAAFLKDNPNAAIVIHPVYHESKEKEHILLFEAKKKYYMEKNGRGEKLSKDDSLKVENLSTLDKSFRLYLDNALKKPLPVTLQEKCYRLLGEDLVNSRYKTLQEERKDIVMKYFNDSKTANQVSFLKAVNEFPFNWFSYFKIDYKGQVPESLKKAYDKLFEINTQPPRRKYFDLFRRGK